MKTKETNYGQGQCVKCGSTNLEYGGMDVDGEIVWYDYECIDCEDDGREIYELKYNLTESNNN